MTASVVSFETLQLKRRRAQILERWVAHFDGCQHVELLQSFIDERHNDYPLRRSKDIENQLKYRALVRVLDERAQSALFKEFIKRAHL